VVKTVTEAGYCAGLNPEAVEEAKRQIKALSEACLGLYGLDLRDKELEIAMAALGDNPMFLRVFYHAKRAFLQFEIGQVENKIQGIWR
jgi:hypothetical protein